MRREQAESALARQEKVRRDLAKLVALFRQGTPPPSDRVADALFQAVSELGDVTRALQDEVNARAKHAKNYRVTTQREGREKTNDRFASGSKAVEEARKAYEAGAVVAEVRRVSDDKVIYDGPAGIELDVVER